MRYFYFLIILYVIITAYFQAVGVNCYREERDCTSKEQDLHGGQKMASAAKQKSCTVGENKKDSSSELTGKTGYIAQVTGRLERLDTGTKQAS